MTDKTVVQALSAVMEDVRAVGKDGFNQAQSYKFRGIDAVVNAVGPALRKHGVVVVPSVQHLAYRDVQTSTGKPSRECTVRVRYTFHGPAGDSIECETPGESLDSGDKGAAKAMSVAFRIALLQALCLPTDDVDPDHGTYERAAEPSHVSKPASDAIRALAAAADKAGLDRSEVSGAYLAKTGVDLRNESDSKRVKAFQDELVLNVTDWLQSQETK